MYSYWFIILLIFTCNSHDNVITCNRLTKEEALENLQEVSNNVKHLSVCYHARFINTRNDYFQKKWSSYFKYQELEHTLIYPLCTGEGFGLGNNLGVYFNEISCAIQSKTNFITIKHYDHNNPLHTIFFDELSKGINNTNIILSDTWNTDIFDYDNRTRIQVEDTMKQVCKCTTYCWMESNAEWINNIPFIASKMRQALNVYYSIVIMNSTNFLIQDTIPFFHINNKYDKSNFPNNTIVPFIPDVIIQYRCGDNMRYGKYGYGLLKFKSYLDIIPNNVKTIYLVSEVLTSICETIVLRLFQYLKDHYPMSLILIHHVNDHILDMIRFADSKITICSSSTFCFYSSLASIGQVYFPVSNLIAHPENKYINHSYGEHFHFMWDSELITQFDKYRPGELVLFDLLDEPIKISDLEGHVVKTRLNDPSVYLILNNTKHIFNCGDDFLNKGYHWEEIWHIDQALIDAIPEGSSVQVP